MKGLFKIVNHGQFHLVLDNVTIGSGKSLTKELDLTLDLFSMLRRQNVEIQLLREDGSLLAVNEGIFAPAQPVAVEPVQETTPVEEAPVAETVVAEVAVVAEEAPVAEPVVAEEAPVAEEESLEERRAELLKVNGNTLKKHARDAGIDGVDSMSKAAVVDALLAAGIDDVK